VADTEAARRIARDAVAAGVMFSAARRATVARFGFAPGV